MESTISKIVEPAVIVTTDQTVSEVISKISSSPLHAVIVTDVGKVAGVASDRTMRDFNSPAATTNALALAVRSPTLESGSSVDEALSYFLDPQFRILPVMASSKLVGVVSRVKVLGLVKDRPRLKECKAKDWASKPDAWIHEGSTISQARSKMKLAGTYHLAVLDEKDQLTSMITSFDIVTKVSAFSHEGFAGKRSGTPTPQMDVSKESIDSIASTTIFKVSPTSSLSEAAGLMIANNVTSVAVVESGKYLGIISVRDCIRALDEHPEVGVFVFGLSDADKFMAESIRSYVQVLMNRWTLKGEADAVYIHLKSHAAGLKRKYTATARAVVGQKVFSVSTPERDDHFRSWEAYSEVKEVMEELGRVLSDKVHSKSDTRDRDRERRSNRDDAQDA